MAKKKASKKAAKKTSKKVSKSKKTTSKKTKSAGKSKSSKKAGVAGRLGGLQKDWNKSEARHRGAALPDGEYEGVIEQVLLEESQNGRLQCRWDLLVTSEECEGRQIRKYNGLETKDNLDWFKGDLECLDIEIPDDLSELGEVLAEAQGLAIAFQVRSKDEFTNIDFIEVLEAGASDEEADEPDEDEETEEEEEEEEADEDEEEAEEDEEEGENYTKKDIKKMKKKALSALAEELDLEPDEYEDLAELRDAVIEVLEL